jgi:hypothetical protein
MASEWYYTLNGQQVPTPASPAILKQLAAAGQLQPTDLVWQEGMPNWLPASTIKGLFAPKSGPFETPAPSDKTAPANKSRSRKSSRGSSDQEGGASEAGLHPVAALLLTMCTGGLFGLFYAYTVCTAFAERNPGKETDASGRRLGQPRHPLGVLVLSYITLGIYFSYWVYKACQECNAYLGRKDLVSRTEWTLMWLFPPYALFVAVFRLADLVKAVAQQAKLPESMVAAHSWVFLNPLLLLVLPVLGAAYQDILNQAWLSES